MGRMIFDYTKNAIIKVCHNKTLFVKELNRASNKLLPHEKENLINWLFFFTADKPELQKWFWECLDKKK